MAATFEPELRPGPPWVMEEMIWAQLDLPEQIARGDDADRLASHLRNAIDDGEPVHFTGCGTSEHAARAAQAIVGDALPNATLASRDAFETRLALPTGGLVVAISHEGGTPATLDAARGASDAGAQVVLITARPERAPAGVEPIRTPLHDRSWCHTVGYLSPLLLHASFAGLSPQRARELIATELAARPQRREDARQLAACARLLVVGSGVDEITAAELALKLEEAIHVPTTPLGAEKVLHGHLPAADRDTGLVLLRFDPDHRGERDRRSAGVAAAASVLDMPTVALGAPDAVTRAEALLAGAVALQLLTLELCLTVGTNPDLIRREQPLYRQVADVSDYQQLPSNLPVPQDDGAADHLPGAAMPPLVLRDTSGNEVALDQLGPGRTVIYLYPLSGRPGVDLPNGWDAIPGARGCTPEACGFRDHHADLQAAGARAVYGLSSQSTDYQAELAARLGLPFSILSDPDLALAEALDLPTFEAGGERLFSRLTLIVTDGRIEHAFYPIFPPDQHAAQVLEWLRGHAAVAR